MKKLNRYLLSSAIKYLLIAQMAGVSMFLVIEFFQHTDRFTESMHAFAMVVLYILLLLPYYFNLILPLAFLVSMLIVLILMIRGNEMIVARTSGISTLSLMKPFLGFSLVLILLSFLLAEWIVPLSANASNYIYQVKIRGEESHVFIKNDRIWFKRDNRICNIDYFDTKKDIIKGLTVLELGNNFAVTKRTDAQQGIWKDGTWHFTGVAVRTFDKNGHITKKEYARVSNIITEQPSIFKIVERNPEEMSYRELSRYISRLREDGHDVRRYLVDLYNKVAFPFINLIMVFAAFSVGLRYAKTKHVSKGIFSGILVGALYWFFHSVSLSLGYSEIFPPLFSAWFSNLLFIASGVIGIVTLRT
ncbi:MAG: Lipopolysaccharide export system permease protein LptG [Syntrophorhabdus sp. PtaB.Bin047]|nr:MAG: Lipopolysaccharide export system permease protein LptG [Syntrophorhabdus sp. PtaB.Bin047]